MWQVPDSGSSRSLKDATMPALKNSLSPSITNMIRMDHTHVLATFHKYHIDASPGTKQALVATASRSLEIHAQLEEEIFYPAMRGVAGDDAAVDKSVPEHNEMRRLIDQLRSMEPTGPLYDQTFMELMRNVMHHVADEETVLLPKAERLLADRLGELGLQMTKRRFQLAAPHTGEMTYNMVRGVPARSMVLMASALLAGTYIARRAFARHP
jgi:hemerythrin superfamily protein